MADDILDVVEVRDVTVVVRRPFAGAALLDFLAYHVVPGVETVVDGRYARTLDLAHGPGAVVLELADDLGSDEVLGPLVAARPGLRLPGRSTAPRPRSAP